MSGIRRLSFTFLELMLAAILLAGTGLVLLNQANRSLEKLLQSKENTVLSRLANNKWVDLQLANMFETLENEGAFEEAPNYAWEYQVFDASTEDGASMNRMQLRIFEAESNQTVMMLESLK